MAKTVQQISPIDCAPLTHFANPSPATCTLVVRLREPLQANRHGLTFLKHCAKLHNIMEREVRKEALFRREASTESLLALPHAHTHITAIEACLAEWNIYKSIGHALEGTGLASMFPVLASVFCDENSNYFHDNSVTWEEYLKTLTTMQQLHCMCEVVHEDLLSLKQNKLVAHQLALLYQFTKKAGHRELKPCKHSIEDHFDRVKAASEANPPCLPPAEKEWLLNLTSEIQERVGPLVGSKIENCLSPLLR